MRSKWIVLFFALVGCADGYTGAGSMPLPVDTAGSTAAGASGQSGMGGRAGAAGKDDIPNPPKAGMMGSAGMMPPAGGGASGSAGMVMGTAGSAGTMQPPMAGSMGTAGSGPAPSGSMNPIVPAVAGDCPDFRNGTISFMGLSGITMVAGTKAAGPTAPMVFYWHGTGSFAGEYAGSAAAVAAGIREEGGVLISFQGTTGGDALSGTFIFGASDFELTDQFLACAVRDHNVDPRRVFATGCSAGGLFSTAMAALRSNYIAAAAPNSGGWSFPSRFQNEWTPALMTIHGAPGVDVVGIDFSVSSRTADMSFKGRGGFVINCNHGGIHCGGGGLSGEVWQFFKAHPYGTKPSPWASGLPSGFSSDCKIFE